MYDILARSILQNAVHEEGSWNKKLCNYLEDISKMAAVDKARVKIIKYLNCFSNYLNVICFLNYHNLYINVKYIM